MCVNLALKIIFYYVLVCPLKLSLGLFEHVCEESQLFMPYIHVYNGRKGEKFVAQGPGFYDVQNLADAYICMNGPVYLYFSMTKSMGQVFNSPKFYLYSHTCDMYNIRPRPGSTYNSTINHLRGILLMGDKFDYRKPSIQMFTAPYYIRGTQTFQNATSLIMMGDSECTLLKGEHKTLIKIRPSKLIDFKTSGFYCQVRYSKLKTNSSAELALRNDEYLRKESCIDPSKMNINDIMEKIEILLQDIKKIFEADFSTMESGLKEISNKTLIPIRRKAMEVEEKLNSSSTIMIRTQNFLTKRLENLKRTISRENTFLQQFQNLKRKCSSIIIDLDQSDELNNLKKKLRSQRNESFNISENIGTKDSEPGFNESNKVINQREKNTKAIWYQMSNLELKMQRAQNCIQLLTQKYADKLHQFEGFFSNRSDFNADSKENSEPTLIEAESCKPLPTLNEQCAKAKPERHRTCNLVKVSSFLKNPWSNRENIDKWKLEILNLVVQIFSRACHRVPSKAVGKLQNLMGFYLTGDDFGRTYQNQRDTCTSSKSLNSLRKLRTDYRSNKISYKKRPFWTSIIKALENCKKQKTTLNVVEKPWGSNNFRLLKTENNTLRHIPIYYFKEQADIEYSYNWVIDMTWKMFSTVLGLCALTHENRAPLISSRFHAMFTEDFFIPLRETWVQYVDNTIFQFILGEYYNSQVERITDACLEASFLLSGTIHYRPPRSLLVNCASEYNYYVNGHS